ncbi:MULTISPECIES: type II toxin-antitoxin system VapC family toxin [unclassified Frankia]|uniref:type II toxin-antitoxin system VapC family toxin n=1 Tax=unclassified Frankia TaxID=2632575 RepID=UPI002023D9CC
MIYLDSCALVKLVVTEAETPALRAFLGAHAGYPQVTSLLARAEVVRAVRRATADDADLYKAAVTMLNRLDHIILDRPVLDDAGAVAGPLVRTLDAIHLAAARRLGDSLTAFVTYDRRLATAALDLGFPVRAP